MSAAPVCSAPAGVRDYIHVVDLADGHCAALQKIFSTPALGARLRTAQRLRGIARRPPGFGWALRISACAPPAPRRLRGHQSGHRHRHLRSGNGQGFWGCCWEGTPSGSGPESRRHASMSGVSFAHSSIARASSRSRTKWRRGGRVTWRPATRQQTWRRASLGGRQAAKSP